MKNLQISILALQFACGSGPAESSQNTDQNSAEVAELTSESTVQEEFTGTIVYAASASGEEESSKLFNDSQADEVRITWTREGFEQRENSGWNRGKTFYKYTEEKALNCRDAEQTLVKMGVQDFAKTDPEVKKFMPHLFAYEIKKTGKSEIIAGYKCDHYEVIKSGFVKAGATAEVWITSDLKLPPSQFSFESEWRRILALLPLQYGFTEGAVMKAVTREPSFTGNGSVEVTYVVKEVLKGDIPDGFLEAPEGYAEGE